MITNPIAEVLVGVTVDPQWGQVLVVGSGGIYTEYHKDVTQILPPWTNNKIKLAISRLRINALLKGYRNKPPVDINALVSAIEAIARYATEHQDTLCELDVNPLIVREHGVVAVDALIRLEE